MQKWTSGSGSDNDDIEGMEIRGQKNIMAIFCQLPEIKKTCR